MRTIPLTRGQFAIVDDEDFGWLNQHRWCALKYVRRKQTGWYAVRDNHGRMMYMHREIMGVIDANIDVDHENGDTLNNRRKNLRVATRSQNLQNQRKMRGCSSQFKGVSFYKRTGRWSAQIKIDGHKRHLGYFENETAAGDAYDQAARQVFGTFALTNRLSTN